MFFTLVPFFTNFIFMGCFEVGTVDLIEDLILLMMILDIIMTESASLFT